MNPDHITDTVRRLHSGSAVVDAALGGGWPRGRIVEVYGRANTGKRSVAIAALALTDAGAWVELHAGESGFDSSYATACGWQNQSVIYLATEAAHRNALQYVCRTVRSGNHTLLVVSGTNLLKRVDELAARVYSQQMRKLCEAAHASGTCVLFLRDEPDPREFAAGIGHTPLTNELRYYASTRVRLGAAPWVDHGRAGILGAGQVVKNKYGDPFARFGYVVQHSRGLVAEDVRAAAAQ